ncbi:hypothetical protein BTH42_18885 [Burkholderia sp. SRS-W-2-2016]|uniref:hypothetical protein n=1 Tax=Burkholderia sp. SRS-W-2-2016 TaxID=1926878 RepID=UPI00094B6E07|nr:hypothetical protein [Burkholderia sp. SRS-W-2-2016]OLL30176.1 hypothetical protein BTH42_18885 [Burkholderia sp. SRS-W-2-2016]
MLFNEIRRLVAWLTHPHTEVVTDPPPVEGKDASPLFDFDPRWHGDHWQNLLSSPMDARHYVMEDWSVSVADDWDQANGTVPAH